MRQAKVHVSIMGSEAQQKLCLHGLRSSAGYIQSKISDRIDTRYTPKLQFVIDEGVKKSLAINQMLRELLPDTNPSPAAVTDDDVSQDNGSSEDDLPDDDSSDDDSSHGDAPDDES